MADGPRDVHDSAFKLLFDHADMVRDLLRGFAPPDLVEAFDFDSLEQVPADYVGDDLRQSRSDRLWRVLFRAEGSQEWLYLLLLLEFQSTVDRYMAARVLSLHRADLPETHPRRPTGGGRIVAVPLAGCDLQRFGALVGAARGERTRCGGGFGPCAVPAPAALPAA